MDQNIDKVRFIWDKDEKVLNLIRCISNYKSQMEFGNKDFNADKVKLYEEVRKLMANIYHEIPAFFGPIIATDNSPEEEKIDKELIKRGYTRVQEKIKSIRQQFTTAVTSGRRSGSGKIVLEHYDELVRIWGGSPSAEPLSFGVSTYGMNNNDTTIVTDNINCNDSDDESIDLEVSDSNNKRKRTGSTDNCVPKLIDNKRKKLERQLSASQRDI